MKSLGIYYGDTLLDATEADESSNKNRIMLEYYRVEKTAIKNIEQKPIYGITIVKKEYERNEIKFEENCVERISTNENKIGNIIETLKKNKVTPVALNDVLADLLKQPQFQGE